MINLVKPTFGKRVLSWFKRSDSANSTTSIAAHVQQTEKSQDQNEVETTVERFESEKPSSISSSGQSINLTPKADDGYETVTTIAAPAAIHSPSVARPTALSSRTSQSPPQTKRSERDIAGRKSELPFLSWPNSATGTQLPASLPTFTGSSSPAGNPDLPFLQWPTSG